MRKQALEWWRNLNDFEKQQIVKEWKTFTSDRKKLYTFDMVAASSSTIEKIYREMIMEENFN